MWPKSFPLKYAKPPSQSFSLMGRQPSSIICKPFVATKWIQLFSFAKDLFITYNITSFEKAFGLIYILVTIVYVERDILVWTLYMEEEIIFRKDFFLCYCFYFIFLKGVFSTLKFCFNCLQLVNTLVLRSLNSNIKLDFFAFDNWTC